MPRIVLILSLSCNVTNKDYILVVPGGTPKAAQGGRTYETTLIEQKQLINFTCSNIILIFNCPKNLETKMTCRSLCVLIRN